MTQTLDAAGTPRSPIDPYDMDSLRDPHRFDGALRDLGPVVYLERWGFHVITQYAEIRKALRDWKTYSSTSRPFYKPNPYRPTILVLEDPPGHTMSKSTVNRLFSPENMAEMEAYFEQEADRMVADLVKDGPVEIDGYADLAMRFVLKVFPDVLGLPEEGREHLMRFGDAVFNTAGPESDLQREKFASGASALGWVEANTVREVQREGKLGWQLYQEVDKGEIEEEFAQQIIKSIFAAGFDTTVAGLAGMVRALADHPDQYALVRSDEELVANAWEETLRFYPPARFAGRRVMKDVEVAGTTIPAGEDILLLLLAAERDPRRFEDADAFRVDRDLSAGHLSFGFGIHTCAGQGIARLEGRALLRALTKHVASIELTGEPRQAINYQAFGHEYVPVRLTPAAKD